MATPTFDLSSLDGSNGFRIDGAVLADYLGESVNNAGDVNGDGIDDVIIGAIGADPNGKSSGSSYVVFGKDSGFDATLNVSTLDGSNGFRLDGEAEADFSGGAVSSAGDINGDGFDDVIVSASRNDANGVDSGSSYIVFGRASDFDAALDLSSLDGSNGFRLNGAVGGDRLGFSVSVGDINGDGFDDVSIGSNYTDPNTGNTSSISYMVFGKASGFNATIEVSSITGSNGFRQDGGVVLKAGDVNGDGFDDFTVGTSVVFGKDTGFTAELNLSNLDGNNGFGVGGVYGLDTIASAGDVNGDGFDDVIVADPGASPNGIPYAGSSFVIFGKASGFDAMLDLSSLDGSNGFRVDGEFGYGVAGGVLSAAGDVNGDGFDDVVLGAVDRRGYGSAYSYVVFGKASGFDAALQLGNMDINTGIRLDDGFNGGGYLGLSVSDAGDINGDGHDDLIVGAPGARYSRNGGVSYVIFGSKVPDIIGTAGNDQLQGTPAAEHFKAGAGDDNMIGFSGADIFEGGDGNDSIRVPDLGFAWIFGDAGNDALHLMGRDLDLNLTKFESKIDGIETIDLSGIGDNTLALTAFDVFNLSDSSNTLIVDGDSGDRVIGLSKDWVEEGSIGNYNRYTQQEAVVMVNRAISTDFSGINLSGLDGTDGFRMDGVAESDRSGSSVSNAGDVNGDGCDDVIVGAPFASTNGTQSGSSYVVFGKTSGFDAAMDLSSLNGSNGFRLDGVAEGDLLGKSVSNAGDVNGDGFDDLLVGALGAGDGSGSSYVVFGKTSGFGAALDLSSLDGSNGFRLDGTAEHDNLGTSVSNAGDVNGDGFDDLIVGAPFDGSNFYSPAGAIYVVFGKASGFSATMDREQLDGSNGFILNGVADGDFTGEVSNAGDVNGDGFDDLIVGARFADLNGDFSGSSYVVFGKTSGFDAAMDLSSLNGSNGFRLDREGFPESTQLGYSVSSAGDVNGDGFDDVIIGAVDSRNYSQISFVVFGKASGFEATLNVSSLDGNNGFRLGSTEDGYSYPGGSVSNAGDVNGDGFDDVIVGAPHADSKYGVDTGFSYVVFGKASGFEAVMNVSELGGRNGFRLDGAHAYDFSGRSVSSAGDVNGDGFDDLLVGAPGTDSNGEDSGSSYVIFGRSDFGSGVPDIPDIMGTPDDDQLKGTAAAEHFKAGAGDDHIIGRGGADIFEGEAGDDKIRVADLDFASVDGGAGNDVLHLAGDGLNLNLADSGAKIQSIESICLFGKGDNTLTLTAADLLNLSDTTNTLRVNGNAAGHIVVQDSGWIDGGIRGSGYYHVYTNDDAVLLVGMNVTIDFA